MTVGLTIYVLMWPVIVAAILFLIARGFFRDVSQAKKEGRPVIWRQDFPYEAAAEEDYGKIRILRLPSNTQVPGPSQIANQFGADQAIQDARLAFTRTNSRVVDGNPPDIMDNSGAGMFDAPVEIGEINGLSVTRILEAIRLWPTRRARRWRMSRPTGRWWSS
mgnify:CR=1 FL=1